MNCLIDNKKCDVIVLSVNLVFMYVTVTKGARISYCFLLSQTHFVHAHTCA
jgi:hypothetical protein